jgi:hypothetical protein
MKLTDMKKKILKLIEEYDKNNNTEYTNDPDIATKLNDVINQVMFELSRIKKIPDYVELETTENKLIRFQDITEKTTYEVYQLDIVKGIKYEYKAQGTIIKCLEEGTAEIEYFRYPKRITEENAETYEFEISNDVLECMPYGVAGDVLKSDVSNAYGNIYSQRYEQMKGQLDIRYNTGAIEIEEGVIYG